ncbi:MAG: PHA/PHB synthase family protein [Panacagrimonas sp.]
MQVSKGAVGTGSRRITGPWLSEERARKLDRSITALSGSATGGLPTPRFMLAYMDWLMNLSLSPGRQLELMEYLARSQLELLASLVGKVPDTSDPRFSAPGWKRKPFSWLAQAALKREAFWSLATATLPGMDRHNAELVKFYTLQLVEALSPVNHPLTNPEILRATREQRGRNLLRGARNFIGDTWKSARNKPAAPSTKFRVGETVAATPGKIIHRNALMELIQYAPTTDTVYAEPVLIFPAWIMKYYILDLSQQNSLVRWLVAQGHTVFMVSWKNPDKTDRDLTMNDYLRLGVYEALDAVSTVLPKRRIHTVGYCVGGTLLAIANAALARENDQRIKTATLFAAQTDFEDAGELRLFIDEMALHWLDQQMAKKGFLETSRMGGAFGMLRARDLIWSNIVRRYWLGLSDEEGMDIMAWNADGTRMPHRMHSDYLRQLYLENQFAQGKYRIGGKNVSMGDVQVPMFVVGTVTDHVAPWKSVYKIRNLKRLGETTFALTTGGHNAGIVSEPGRARRKYQLGSWDQDAPYQSPDEWAASAESFDGSWWPAWQKWLAEHSADQQITPPEIGQAKTYSVLGEAPGTYVLQR